MRGISSTRATQVLGSFTALFVVATVVMGLWVTPADEVQQDAVRLLYLHVPTAWIAMYLAFGVTTLASVLFLIPRTSSRFWDLIAGAAAEIGVLFLALTLVLGSVWGRSTWGVWWTWDARLTSTAVLLLLYVGYLALRRLEGDRQAVAKRAAVAAIVSFLQVPIVYKSVEWWRTLHQESSLLARCPGTKSVTCWNPSIHGSMAWTLLLGVVAFTLLFAWLLLHRFRLAWLEDQSGRRALDDLVASRRAEAAPVEVSR